MNLNREVALTSGVLTVVWLIFTGLSGGTLLLAFVFAVSVVALRYQQSNKKDTTDE